MKGFISPCIEKIPKFSPPLRLGVMASGEGTNFQAIINSITNQYLDAEIKLLIVNKINSNAIKRAIKYNIPYKLIDHKKTRLIISAERELIKEIKGDCFTPIGVYANIEKACLKIRARLFSTDGLKYIEVRKESCAMNAKDLGKVCAKEILSKIKFRFKKR